MAAHRVDLVVDELARGAREAAQRARREIARLGTVCLSPATASSRLPRGPTRRPRPASASTRGSPTSNASTPVPRTLPGVVGVDESTITRPPTTAISLRRSPGSPDVSSHCRQLPLRGSWRSRPRLVPTQTAPIPRSMSSVCARASGSAEAVDGEAGPLLDAHVGRDVPALGQPLARQRLLLGGQPRRRRGRGPRRGRRQRQRARGRPAAAAISSSESARS